jgi:hypothetical protein
VSHKTLDALVPEYDLQKKVDVFIALSPVAHLKNCASALLHALAFVGVGDAAELVWPFGFLTDTKLEDVAHWICEKTFGYLCRFAKGVVCGFTRLDSPQLMTFMSSHFPDGTSVKEMNFYAQAVNSETLQLYDYGEGGNERVYGTPEPPRIELEKMRTTNHEKSFLQFVGLVASPIFSCQGALS